MLKSFRTFQFNFLQALLLLLVATACLDKKEEDPGPATIIGKWKVTRHFSNYSGEDKWTDMEGRNFFINFGTDGKITLEEPGSTVAGTYTFDKEKLQLHVDFGNKGSAVYSVTTFTAKDLAYEYHAGNDIEKWEMKK